MSNKIIPLIIYSVTLMLYLFSDNLYLKISLFFILSAILVSTVIKEILNESSKLFTAVTGMVILILLFATFLYQPFTVTKNLTEGEYISFGKTKEHKLHKLNGKLTVINNNGVDLIKFKDENSFLIKKEYKKNIKINNYQIDIVSKSKYLTGNYILYIKNNVTNENQEYPIANNGNIKFNNGIKIEMLNKSDNFKNLGKAIQIKYNFPQSKRNHKQWLYKDYKEFNLIVASDDPLTIMYANDETKNIYNLKITFIPPFQKIIFYLIIILSLIFLTLSLQAIKKEKNEN